MNTHFKNSIIIFSAIALFIIIILGSFNLMIFNRPFYETEYSKNNVYKSISEKYSINTTQSVAMVDDITSNIFKFFNGKEDLQNFYSKETSHMQDVKSVINTMRIIYYTSVVLFVLLIATLYFYYKKDSIAFIDYVSKTLYYSSIAQLAFFALIFFWSVFYFDALFIIFHAILFPQGNWIFDASSLLITLFPQQFFFDITLRIFIYGIMQAVVLFIIGYWLRKQIKLHKKYH